MVTVTVDPAPVTQQQAVAPPAPAAAPPSAPPPRPLSNRAQLALRLPSTALTIIAVLALTFVGHLAGVSQLQYARTQQIAYADFRAQLARGEAPVGQYKVEFTDSGEERQRLLHPGEAVAVLRIPALHVRTVVLEGTSSDVLESGPGHRRDTVLPGQAGTSVIMGRKAAYGGPFRDLDRLVPGDAITVITGQGEQQYRVTGLRLPGDPAPAPLEAAAGRLTLVTAAGPRFAPTDLLRVDAELISAVRPTPARKFGAAALPAAEQAMATDPAGWTPLVLWGQALLLAALALAWARVRWGGWQTWVAGVPLLGALGLAAADQGARLLPNLL
jgi:LPXTG-site transpeptidase (sortase) family protein